LSVALKQANPTGQVKRKSVVRAVVVRTTNAIRRPDGSLSALDDNAVVVIGEDKLPKATRILAQFLVNYVTKVCQDYFFSTGGPIMSDQIYKIRLKR